MMLIKKKACSKGIGISYLFLFISRWKFHFDDIFSDFRILFLRKNPWCHRQVIYIIRCIYLSLSSFTICKHIFCSSFGFREMKSLVTPKIFFKNSDVSKILNSFFWFNLWCHRQVFYIISSASSTCLISEHVSKLYVAFSVSEILTR